VTRIALLIACILLIAVAPARAAESGHAPPGNAAIDEYVEDVPDSEGDRPFGPDGPGGGGATPGGATGGDLGDGSKLDAKTRAELARHGADGYRVAALTERSAPGEAKAGAASAAAAGDDGGSGGGSRLAASAEALNGEAPGGMGAWLPILLGASAIAAIAAAVLSRRRA